MINRVNQLLEGTIEVLTDMVWIDILMEESIIYVVFG